MKTIKVLHINTSYGWRGGENQVYLLLKGLKERGVESFLVTPPQSKLGEKIKREGIPVKEIVFKGEIDLIAISHILRFSRWAGVNIFHAHTSHAHTLAGISGRVMKKKIVVTRRVDFPPRGPLSRWKYKNLADRIIVISRCIEEVMKKTGVNEERLRYVPSAINVEWLEKRKDPSYLFKEFPLHHPILGCVAHLTDHKGHIYLLKALPYVLKEFPQTTLLLVGKGELENYLKKEVKKLGIEKNVIFTGFREDVPEILSILDLFVLPSHMEGLGTSLLDAQYLGIPVVSTYAGGIPEIVKDGETGILVPPRDEKSLGEAIVNLLKDKKKRESFSLKGREWAKNFLPQRMVEGTITVYQELL